MFVSNSSEFLNKIWYFKRKEEQKLQILFTRKINRARNTEIIVFIWVENFTNKYIEHAK